MQHLVGKDFGGSQVAQALPGSVVVGLEHLQDFFFGQLVQVSLSGQEAAQATVGILHTALLPRGVSVTKEGVHAQGMEAVMLGEFAAVVEGDGLTPRWRYGQQEIDQGVCNGARRFLEHGLAQEQPRVALLEHQQRLSSVAEEHEVRLPVPRVEAVLDIWGPEGEGLALVDIGIGVSPTTSEAPFGLASGQESEPGVVLGSIALGMDEAVDGLMGYEGAARFQGQATSHLLGGPASAQSPQDLVPQGRVAVQLGTAPATSSSLLLGIGGIIPFGFGYVTHQLSSNRRWRAIHTCRDLALSASLSL